jgi:hypothetical protein
VTLGTQSLAEGLGIWRYFPVEGTSPPVHFSLKHLFVPAADPDFDKDTLTVDSFQRKASEDEKQQYERFVVIKEACGNLFVAGILSIPAWYLGNWVRSQPARSQRFATRNQKERVRTVLCIIYIGLIFVGLHRMHSQHVYNQLNYAQKIKKSGRGIRTILTQASVPRKYHTKNLSPKTVDRQDVHLKSDGYNSGIVPSGRCEQIEK